MYNISERNLWYFYNLRVAVIIADVDSWVLLNVCRIVSKVHSCAFVASHGMHPAMGNWSFVSCIVITAYPGQEAKWQSQVGYITHICFVVVRLHSSRACGASRTKAVVVARCRSLVAPDVLRYLCQTHSMSHTGQQYLWLCSLQNRRQ